MSDVVAWKQPPPRILPLDEPDVVADAVGCAHVQGLLTAKIDQKNEVLRVSSCTSRDITTEDVSAVLENISAW